MPESILHGILRYKKLRDISSLLPTVMTLLFRMLWKNCWKFGKAFQRKIGNVIEASRADAVRMMALWLVPRRFLRQGWMLVRRMRNMFIN